MIKFQSAKPVWAKGREKEMNLTVGFVSPFQWDGVSTVTLRSTGSCVYRIFVNGKFSGHGPARGPHGWFRVDEWDVTCLCTKGKNVVAYEVAGYNVDSFYLLEQPSFLQAEVESNGRILTATGGKAWIARPIHERLQKVHRYSYQRTFSEIHRLKPGWDGWRTKPAAIPASQRVPLSIGANRKLLPRGVALPDLTVRQPTRLMSSGHMEPCERPFHNDLYLVQAWKHQKNFPVEELESTPSLEVNSLKSGKVESLNSIFDPTASLGLKKHDFHLFDFGVNLCGFPGAEVVCKQKTRLMFYFAEIAFDGDIRQREADGTNIVAYELAPGRYSLEALEPYLMRYLKFIVLEGACTIRAPFIRLYVNREVHESQFSSSDPRLNRIFEAGRETYRQNALDIFMDCPSRERAGWLCDSFFTARAAMALSGHANVERNFLENFLLPATYTNEPPGMLPMCYPSDHKDFLPNWAMWFVVELEEYLQRSGDRKMVDALKPKVTALFKYFDKFRNSDGLLEKLAGWVFVEWSRANDFVQDVNYPTNMLYAGALAAAGRLYKNKTWLQRADQMRATICNQSFNGEFFVDNAMRGADGALTLTTNRSETCQYYAFFLETATPTSHPGLYRLLVESFGPHRDVPTTWPEVHQSNAFIGVMLRLEILSRYGEAKRMMDESTAYWLVMAETTGTLWEHLQPSASCSHGFTAHVCHAFHRDVLGLRKVDTVKKEISLRFNELSLEWADGKMPTPDGLIELAWKRASDGIRYRLLVPAGYQVTVDPASVPCVHE